MCKIRVLGRSTPSLPVKTGSVPGSVSLFGFSKSVMSRCRDFGRRHFAYGFVRFLKSEAAETAIREKNGFILLGRAIRVGWASDNPDKKLPQDKKCADRVKEDPTAQLHVGFVAKDFRFAVTEATLRKLYSQFGDLIDVTIKKNKFSKVREVLLYFLSIFETYNSLIFNSNVVLKLAMDLSTIH